MNRAALTIAAAAVAAVLAGQSGAAKVKVHADHEKAFNFSQSRTWDWSPESPGDIILAHDVGADRRLVALRGLAAMIDGLRARGFGFATVSDLVATRADTSDPALASRGPARW